MPVDLHGRISRHAQGPEESAVDNRSPGWSSTVFDCSVQAGPVERADDLLAGLDRCFLLFDEGGDLVFTAITAGLTKTHRA